MGPAGPAATTPAGPPAGPPADRGLVASQQPVSSQWSKWAYNSPMAQLFQHRPSGPMAHQRVTPLVQRVVGHLQRVKRVRRVSGRGSRDFPAVQHSSCIAPVGLWQTNRPSSLKTVLTDLWPLSAGPIHYTCPAKGQPKSKWLKICHIN